MNKVKQWKLNQTKEKTMKKYSTVLIVLLGVLSQSTWGNTPEEKLIANLTKEHATLSPDECKLWKSKKCNSMENYNIFIKSLQKNKIIDEKIDYTYPHRGDFNSAYIKTRVEDPMQYLLCGKQPTSGDIHVSNEGVRDAIEILHENLEKCASK